MHLLSSCINTYQHTKLIPTFATEVYVSFFLSVPVKCMSMSSLHIKMYMCQYFYNAIKLQKLHLILIITLLNTIKIIIIYL
jgi:hypothetical protein